MTINIPAIFSPRISALRKAASILFLCATSLAPVALSAAVPGEELPEDFRIYNVFGNTVFYDGYKTDKVVDADLDDGILRFTNYHYAKKLDAGSVAGLGSDLKLEVLIGALCDNYDRMGRVMLAFPDAGSDTYMPEQVQRIEIARFITPFMNKNKTPKQVPYIYDVNDLRAILTDTRLLAGKDIWMEVEVFGIPYAANQQVAGCKDRNDVFSATVSLGGDGNISTADETPRLSVTPITVAQPEIKGNVNLNNYNPAATDTLGTTTRTYIFDVPADLDDAIIYLINTNHGAGEEGEEYIRRRHLIYVDSDLKSVYTPGGVSCEPYRYLNTQLNGIYGYPGDVDDWEEWSNWCPGQAVPVRRIPLGTVKAGSHTLMIRVPDAEFYGSDGDFRPSAFLLGAEGGILPEPSAISGVYTDDSSLRIIPGLDNIRMESEFPIREMRIYTYDGTLIEGRYNPGEIYNVSFLPAGQYIVTAVDAAGHFAYLKYIRQ